MSAGGGAGMPGGGSAPTTAGNSNQAGSGNGGLGPVGGAGLGGESGRRQWDGIIDEARVMQAARSPSWAKLDYESQRPGQTSVVLGPAAPR